MQNGRVQLETTSGVARDGRNTSSAQTKARTAQPQNTPEMPNRPSRMPPITPPKKAPRNWEVAKTPRAAPRSAEPATNSSKNDVLPDLDLYLPRLAKLHSAAIEAAKERPKLLEDYVDCFKQDTTDLLALGESGFSAKYREVIVPQAQIARNLGFQFGWKLRN